MPSRPVYIGLSLAAIIILAVIFAITIALATSGDSTNANNQSIIQTKSAEIEQTITTTISNDEPATTSTTKTHWYTGTTTTGTTTEAVTTSQIISCGRFDLLWNGECDAENNFMNCQYDKGACIPGIFSIFWTTVLYFSNISLDCSMWRFVADDHCDLHLNTIECNFDGGDCLNSPYAHCHNRYLSWFYLS